MGPFERHLRDAIALNRERAPLYAALSDGASKRISRRLILAECALLPVARWFDWAARPYHASGIPLLDEIFEPMSAAPRFAPGGQAERPRAERTRAAGPRPADVRQRILSAYRATGFDGAATALAAEIDELATTPATDCLARHLLESADRVASLAPRHIRLAQARGLRSPQPLLGRLLALHLAGIGAASSLDSLARPLQIRGIAILAQDLPPIRSSGRAL